MIIRNQQIEQMQQSWADQYVESLAHHLEREFPAQVATHCPDPSGLRRVVRKAVSEAEGYGISAPADMQFYMECIAILGPGFDTSARTPWTGEILRRDDLSGTSKMDAINERLLFSEEGPR